jgi:hypothetical protein
MEGGRRSPSPPSRSDRRPSPSYESYDRIEQQRRLDFEREEERRRHEREDRRRRDEERERRALQGEERSGRLTPERELGRGNYSRPMNGASGQGYFEECAHPPF